MNKSAQLVGSAHAASKIGVSRATFNRWAKSGRVPVAVEMDGQTGARLYDAAVIDRLAAEHRAELMRRATA